MSAFDRARFAGGLFMSAGIAGVWWLYFKPSVEPLLDEHAGVFSEQWQMLEWAMPTTILLIMLVAGAYLVYGGVQEEKNRDRRRV